MRVASALVLLSATASACAPTAASVAGAPPRAVPTTTVASSAGPHALASSANEPLADAATWQRWRNADYVIVTAHRFVSALAPLVKHREATGHTVALLEVEALVARAPVTGSAPRGDARLVQAAIRQLAAHTSGKLKFVFLAGDVHHPDETASSDAAVPTFYLNKLTYEHHSAEEHQRGRGFGVTATEHEKYPTDNPYASGQGATPKLAVGRVPARTEAEMRGFVEKAIGYETSRPSPNEAWRRKVSVFAGPANFGQPADSMIETMANQMLDEELSYDYDVSFTFAKLESPYAYRFDRMRQKFVGEMNEGAMVAAYVGHGAVTSFDDVYFRSRYYPIATAEDAAAMRIPAGKPVFFSLSCDTGAFDRPNGVASVAEQMILNPEGPIAVFAASRESHPYPNALYGASLIANFVNAHPQTVGEGVLAVKEGMQKHSIPMAELLVDTDVGALKREHEGLYNLFGDPATRLRYAEAATIAAPANVAAGATFTVTVTTPSVTRGRATLTLESQRSVMPASIVRGAAMQKMAREELFETMAENHRKANDKVISRVEQAVSGGHATFTLTAPAEAAAGGYILKVLASGETTAAGHARLAVSPR